jgi:hypothetical protein
VRELDVAGSAVEGALSRIKLVIDRSSCIDGVKGAMESEDYEAAARFISTYMHLNPRAAALEQGQVRCAHPHHRHSHNSIKTNVLPKHSAKL